MGRPGITEERWEKEQTHSINILVASISEYLASYITLGLQSRFFLLGLLNRLGPDES
ncbi:hypothetical protein Hanom_Chr04g00282391 [Helianthus anomalus]